MKFQLINQSKTLINTLLLIALSASLLQFFVIPPTVTEAACPDEIGAVCRKYPIRFVKNSAGVGEGIGVSFATNPPREVKFNGDKSAKGTLENVTASSYDIAELTKQVTAGLIVLKNKASRAGVPWATAIKNPDVWFDDCATTGKAGILRRYNGGNCSARTPTAKYVSEVRNWYQQKPFDQAVALATAQTTKTDRAKEILDINATIETVAASQGFTDTTTDILKALWWHETVWQPSARNYQWASSQTPVNQLRRIGSTAFVVGPADNQGQVYTVGFGFTAVTNYWPGGATLPTLDTVQYQDYVRTGVSDETTGYYFPSGKDYFDDELYKQTDREVNEFLLVDADFVPQSTVKALETSQALPEGILGDCQATVPQTTASQIIPVKSNALLKCINSIIRIIFVISIIFLILRISAIQLGFVANAGEESLVPGGGSGPIIATRDALRDGLIGLILIGGALLILTVFNTSFGTLSF